MRNKRSCVTISPPIAVYFCKTSEFRSLLKSCSRLRNESALKACKSTNADDQQTFFQPVTMDTERDNVSRFKGVMRVCNVNTAQVL